MPNVLIAPVGADNREAPPESPGILTTLVLEAALRGAGIRPDVFLYFDERWPAARKRFLEQVNEKKYDIIGLSFLSYNRLETYDVLRDLASAAPDCTIILGGVHASFMFEQLLREFPNVAAVAIGEGEQALIAFCRNPHDLASVPGIAYIDGTGKLRVNPRSRLGPGELDDQPIVDYTLIKDYHGPIPLQSSRGCVGQCIFCSWKAMERRVKAKSPERIVKEWAAIRELFGPDRRIAVMDPLYNVSAKHVKDMCRALIDAGMTSNPWDAEIRAKPLDREMIGLMKQAGCKRLMIGVETGVEEIRKNIGKGVSNEDIRTAFALSRELKMTTLAFLITGLPGETEETVVQTIEFARSLKPYYPSLCVPPQIYPGSGLYEMMKSRGLISDEYWLHRHPRNWGHIDVCANMPLYTAENNMVELMKWCSMTNQAGRMFESSISREQLIMNDEEFDRFDPWRRDEAAGRLPKMFDATFHGTPKGWVRRWIRPMHTELRIVPPHPRRDQFLALTMDVQVHRPADLYLFLSRPDGSVLCILPGENGLNAHASPGPFATELGPGFPRCWTETVDPAIGFREPGRYTLWMIVCGVNEPLLRRESWLDWKKRVFVVREGRRRG